MSLIVRFLDPKNDFAFKQVFGTEKHQAILIHFLNDVLKFEGEQQIQMVQFLSPVQSPEIAAKKQSIVDVLCKDETGRQFIIEMQVAKTTGFKERAVYYASKAYVNQMVKGGHYEGLKEVIFIAIIDYELFPHKINYHSSHRLCDQETHERDLEGIRFEFLELPRFKHTLDNVKTMIEKWCYYFKYAPETTPEELEKLVGSDVVMKGAYQALDSVYWTEEELQLYEREIKSENDALSMLRQAELEGMEKGMEEGMEQGMKKGMEKGMEKGIEKGIEKGMEKGMEKGIEKGLIQGRKDERWLIAKNLLQVGVAASVIAQSTGLTEVEINSL